MELTIVRHGEPQRGLEGTDRADPWLSDRGHEQAVRVARHLQEEAPYQALYCSPLLRARQTADHIGEALGLAPMVDEGLSEFDRHAPEYLHFEDLKAADDPRYHAFLRGDLSAWGTDAATFRAEVLEAMDRIVERHRGQRVVVVSHGGVTNVFLGTIIGLDRLSFHAPEYTGISRVIAGGPGKRGLVSINETAHLRGLPAAAHTVGTASPHGDKAPTRA